MSNDNTNKSQLLYKVLNDEQYQHLEELAKRPALNFQDVMNRINFIRQLRDQEQIGEAEPFNLQQANDELKKIREESLQDRNTLRILKLDNYAQRNAHKWSSK